MPKANIDELRVDGAVRTLLVAFGDQLDHDSAGLRDLDPSRDAVLMMEVAEEATHVTSHKQRTTLFLSAMRHYALELAQRGFRVHYIRLDEPDNTGGFDGEVRRAVKQFRPERLAAVRPGDWRVLHMFRRWRDELDIPVDAIEDTHFYTTPQQFSEWAAGRRSLVMEYFYREMRKSHDVLMTESGKPVGGEWNFDKQNRERYRRRESPPSPPSFEPDEITRDVVELVQRQFPKAPGSIDSFRWPVTREQARRALQHFIKHRLADFGPYQDAMVADEPWMFHSILSPCFNLKLLNPREAVDAAVEAYERGDAPLNSVEGFVRQLLGWREFIRGVYWHEGAAYGDRNELAQHCDLPDFYYSGDTDMQCMQDCLGQVIEHGYGHHIQRLMVTGNFALISGVHPRQISDWYLEMYVDAVDWVTLPNTLGMVMHADGGVVGTKPYAASGQYIKRMSNYCQGCRFDPGEKVGDDACPFTTFYWDFLIRNRARFEKNNRMTMMLKNLDRLSESQQSDIKHAASGLRRKWGMGAVAR